MQRDKIKERKKGSHWDQGKTLIDIDIYMDLTMMRDGIENVFSCSQTKK